MKIYKIFIMVLIVALALTSIAYAEETPSLSEAISQSQTNNTDEAVSSDEEATGDAQANESESQVSSSNEESNQEVNEQSSENSGIGSLIDVEPDPEQEAFINGLNEAADLTPAVGDASPITDGAKYIAGYIVNVVSILIVVFLSVTILLDLAYVALPITRGFLANGFSGTPQQSQGGAGFPGAGLSSYGSNGFGNNYGGYGSGGYGSGGYGNGNQQRPNKLQLVSTAALNAVASENTTNPNGKSVSPLKIYAKSMVTMLVVVPVLIVLAVTGVLSELGFAIAGLLVDGIRSISNMI